jgi:diguanylate cyclase (GGDEF)-like protein
MAGLSEEAQAAAQAKAAADVTVEDLEYAGAYDLLPVEQEAVLDFIDQLTDNEITALYGADVTDELRAAEDNRQQDQEDEINAIAERERDAPEATPEVGQRQAESDVTPSEGSGAETRTTGAGTAATGQVNRRTDTSLREKYAAMSDQERFDALYRSDLTVLKNRRAYNESAKLPVQVSIDADSLKFINDNWSHGAGDDLLKAIGRAIESETDNGYHLSGDEFVVQAQTQAEADQIMRAVSEKLATAVITFTKPDGTKLTKTGLGVSYGIADTLERADDQLKEHKLAREREGSRAGRGQEPPGIRTEPPARNEDNRGENPESGQVNQAPADATVPSPMQAALRAAAQANRAAADAFELAAQTPEQLAEIEAKKKAAEEAKAKADREAAEKEAKDNERKTVQRRMEGANADFQLGQSAEENLSGQRGMFDTILPAKLFPRFEFPAGKAYPATAMEDAKRILGINGRFPIKSADLELNNPARIDPATGVIEFDPKQMDSRSHAAQAAAEEILHAIDLVAPNTTISSTSKRLGIGGDIRAELTNHFNENGEYRNWLDYPFLFRIDLSEDRIKAELFARMGVAYNGDPDLLKLHLPKTYEAFHGLFNLIRESGSSDAYLRRSLPQFDVARIFSRNRQTDGQRLARPGEDTGNAGGRDEGSGLEKFYQRLADIFDGRPKGRVVSLGTMNTQTPSNEGVSTSTQFSRGQSPQSLDPTDAKAAVDVIKSKWKNAPKINVWESFDQAPAGLRDEIERAGAQDARGAWFADEIHLFPQNIPNLAALERTLVHESRHAGLEGVFGRDLNPVLMNLYLKNAELRKEVNALTKKTGLNTVNQINEVLADKPLAYAQKLSGWKQVVGKMKEWFEKNGFTRLAAMLDGPTADELVKDVLYQAEEFIRSGKKSTTLTGGAMFSTGEDFYSRENADNVTVEKLSYSLPNGAKYKVTVNKGTGNERQSYYTTESEANDAADRLRAAATNSEESSLLRAENKSASVRDESGRDESDSLGLAAQKVIAKRKDSIKSPNEALRIGLQ